MVIINGVHNLFVIVTEINRHMHTYNNSPQELMCLLYCTLINVCICLMVLSLLMPQHNQCLSVLCDIP